MKTEIYTCDIKDCENNPKYKGKKMQVVFITETTEGRSTEPHLCDVIVDICEECLNKMAKERKYITAEGAMGYNTYKI